MCYHGAMTDYIKRLVYIDEAEKVKVNPLIWPFFACIIVYGLGFAFFGGFDFVSSSSLFQSFDSVHTWLPQVWGVAALLSGLAAVTMVLFRKAFLGGAAAMNGFLVWLFAVIVYLLNGYLLVAISVGAVNLYFWVYYYFRLHWYLRMKARGIIHDPV